MRRVPVQLLGRMHYVKAAAGEVLDLIAWNANDEICLQLRELSWGVEARPTLHKSNTPGRSKLNTNFVVPIYF